MRPFGEPIGEVRRAELVAAIADVYAKLPSRRDILAADYLMEPPERVVIRVGELKVKDGPRLRIGATEADARPPFEWIYEVTSDVTEADYFKHYLVLGDQIVLAHLKVLTPIDEAEAQIILADLELVSRLLVDPE
jgi:hypothetical protein